MVDTRSRDIVLVQLGQALACFFSRRDFLVEKALRPLLKGTTLILLAQGSFVKGKNFTPRLQKLAVNFSSEITG